MEQFRKVGEVLGSLKALMVFKENIQINQRQCLLLLDILTISYDSVAEEMRHNLQYEEKHTKWTVLEQPLRELHRTFKEAETYIKQCLETKDWWAKAIALYQNTDCIEFHIHNLLSNFWVVIEAIETAGEISGGDRDEIQKKKLVYLNKYRKENEDPKIFRWRFGKQYLINQDFCHRLSTVGKEDRWILQNNIKENKILVSSKNGQRLKETLLKCLSGTESSNEKLLPSSILLKSKDYHVRRRLGAGSQYKEIVWFGESFAMRHFFGEIEKLTPEISSLLSLSHPNIMQFLCGFTDEGRNECFLLMELMSRDLCNYIKEIGGKKKRIPFSLPVAVDLMLQIARGMEYLHSKKIYHGNLNPSNILVKPRGVVSSEGYLQAKVSEFGLSFANNTNQKNSSCQNDSLPFIWFAPEVLEEQELTGNSHSSKYTEKSDVYSFAMVCFELLTGKVPFEDSHLQGDKMSRNIRAGERPLFPFGPPKYITSLTKKCWHSEPNQRPTFSSISRILRYIKRFLALNPDYNNEIDAPVPSVDYCDIEAGFLRKSQSWADSSSDPRSVSEIPLQMFVYRVTEKERAVSHLKDNSESESDGASVCGSGDEIVMTPIDEPFPSSAKSSPDNNVLKRLPSLKKPGDMKVNKPTSTSKGRCVRPPLISPCGRTRRLGSESNLMLMSPRAPRTSGHASDPEMSSLT